MLSLLPLFESTKKEKRSSRKYIKDISRIPLLRCPEIDSKTHKQDIEALKHYYENRSLSPSFLKAADDSCKKIFKNYCQQNNLYPDWDYLKDVLKDVNAIVFGQKQKYDRPRPKEILTLEDDYYDDIIDVDSPSFPSGHTTTAYFMSGLLSDSYPEHSNNFKTIAELIGQSRIENCVHYPSDVLNGQFLGELLVDLFLNQNNNELSDMNITRKDEKEFSKFLRSMSDIEETAIKLADFLQTSNKIEGYNISYDDCLDSCYHIIEGYPIKDIKDKHLQSHLKSLCLGNKLKDTNNISNLINIHKMFDPECIEKGEPGMIRDYNHYAKYGNAFSEPNKIIDHLKQLKYAKNPFLKHIIYEWIHPFCDGNGRSGRIILLLDTNFDFDKVNDFISNDYLETIKNFVDKHKNINSILGV